MGLSREQYAAMLTADMAGFDTEGDDGIFGADDPIKRGGLSTLTIQLTIANAQQLGNAATGVNLFNSADVDAAALPTGIAAPTLANYKQIVRYMMTNPSLLQSVVFSSNETATGGAPVLSSIILTPTRNTPFGLTNANASQLQAYQTTQDFQANRTTVPLRAVLDGFTILNLISAVNGSGAAVTVNCVFFIGKRVEARKQIKGGAPIAMRPNGRGPAPVR